MTTTQDWSKTTELVGIGGYPAAGDLSDTPPLVGYRRDRGYPWQPWATLPERFLTGASSIGKAVDKDWDWWARRVCARIAARDRTELAAMTNARACEQHLYKTAEDEQGESMRFGSAVHDYTAIEDAQRPQTRELNDDCMASVESWRAFVHENNVRFGAIERTGYAINLGTGVAGTIDRVVAYSNADTNGVERVAVVDLKTKVGKPVSRVEPSPKDLIQIVALAHSTHIAIERERVLIPLPRRIEACLVYAARDGYRAYWPDPHDPEIVAGAIGCIAAAKFKQGLGSGAFGRHHTHRTRNGKAAPKLVAVPDNKERS